PAEFMPIASNWPDVNRSPLALMPIPTNRRCSQQAQQALSSTLFGCASVSPDGPSPAVRSILGRSDQTYPFSPAARSAHPSHLILLDLSPLGAPPHLLPARPTRWSRLFAQGSYRAAIRSSLHANRPAVPACLRAQDHRARGAPRGRRAPQRAAPA